MKQAEEERKCSGIHYLSSREANGGGKARWVLNRGLRVGKQILMAGFLASSAPVVLPPLVIVSVIGISVSMPYGIFLASHACTQKLMSKLLPMPTSTPQGKEEGIVVCQEEDVDRIDVQEAVQEKQTTTGIQIVHVKHENTTLGNEDGGGVVRKDEKASPEAQVVITIEGIDKIGNDNVELEIRSTVTLEEFRDDDIELEKETKGLLGKIRDEGKSDTRDQEGVANASDPRTGPIGNGDERKEDPEASDPIKEVDDRNGIDSQKPIPSVENADETIVDPEEYTYTIELREESFNAMVDEQTDPTELAVSYVQNSTQSEYSSARDIMSLSYEVMLNEEKLWKEMNAIRLIVGYEGTPQASCIDELKNLYIVTGVEPPTLNDPCNLHEINDKIHFLMSILGVKSDEP